MLAAEVILSMISMSDGAVAVAVVMINSLVKLNVTPQGVVSTALDP
jgi:hypothetical protein